MIHNGGLDISNYSICDVFPVSAHTYHQNIIRSGDFDYFLEESNSYLKGAAATSMFSFQSHFPPSQNVLSYFKSSLACVAADL